MLSSTAASVFHLRFDLKLRKTETTLQRTHMQRLSRFYIQMYALPTGLEAPVNAVHALTPRKRKSTWSIGISQGGIIERLLMYPGSCLARSIQKEMIIQIVASNQKATRIKKAKCK
jgi:hypothetical protein